MRHPICSLVSRPKPPRDETRTHQSFRKLYSLLTCSSHNTDQLRSRANPASCLHINDVMMSDEPFDMAGLRMDDAATHTLTTSEGLATVMPRADVSSAAAMRPPTDASSCDPAIKSLTCSYKPRRRPVKINCRCNPGVRPCARTV